MTTQVNPPSQPKKRKSNSHGAPDAQPKIVASTVTTVVRQVVEPLTDEQRRDLIAVTAFYLAQSRGFEPGHEEEDWLAAELQIGSLGALVS
jgi:hypothetical protein